MYKCFDLIMLIVLFMFSLLSFLGGRAVRQKVHQCFSSAHSPDTTANQDTKTRATPTRIEQRAEKMSTLEGVSRGEQLPIKRTRHRMQCMYVHIRPLATCAGDTTKSEEQICVICSKWHAPICFGVCRITSHWVLCYMKANSLSYKASRRHRRSAHAMDDAPKTSFSANYDSIHRRNTRS